MGIASVEAVAVTEATFPPRKTEVIPRFPVLDGLRGIAVIAVIALHVVMGITSNRANHADRLIDLFIRITGIPGVDLFFVLSGFLITSILDATRASTHPFRIFYARRFLRIVPLYFAFLLLVPMAFSWLGPFAVGTFSNRLWHWAFLTNFEMTQLGPFQVGFLFGHLWSLSIEEQFYLFWPLIVLSVPRRYLVRVGVALTGCSVLARVALTLAGKAHFGWLLMPSRIDGLMAGAIIAVCAVDNPERVRNAARAILKPVTALVLIYIGAMVAALWHSTSDIVGMLATQLASRRAEIVILPFLSALFFSCIVALAVTDAAVFPRWVRSEWLRNTGRYSYGMYLLHPVVMLILLIPGTPLTYRIGGFDFIYQVTMIFVLLFLSRMVAGFSWRRFEKRVLTIAPPYKFPPESKAA